MRLHHHGQSYPSCHCCARDGLSLRLVQVCSVFLFETMRNARNDPRYSPRNVPVWELQALRSGAMICPCVASCSLFSLGEDWRGSRIKEATWVMSMSISQSFDDLLRRYRLAAGLTQERLADLAGLSVRGLSDLERGARRVPRRETVHLLSEALHLSPDEQTRLEVAARKHRIRVAQMIDESLAAPPSNLPSSPFVGRVQELALLDQVLKDGPPVLLVAGEPGIGKSRLLQAGSERARTQGWTVLMGGGRCCTGGWPRSWRRLCRSLLSATWPITTPGATSRTKPSFTWSAKEMQRERAMLIQKQRTPTVR